MEARSREPGRVGGGERQRHQRHKSTAGDGPGGCCIRELGGYGDPPWPWTRHRRRAARAPAPASPASLRSAVLVAGRDVPLRVGVPCAAEGVALVSEVAGRAGD